MLTGRTALVTGGKRIGQVVAESLAQQGADIVLSYRSSRAEAEETAARVRGLGRRALVRQADVSRPDDCAGLVADSAWPQVDPAMLVEDEVTIAVQVKGKLRDTLTVTKGLPGPELEALALASEKVQRSLDGAEVRKVIVVPDRLVNIVA